MPRAILVDAAAVGAGRVHDVAAFCLVVLDPRDRPSEPDVAQPRRGPPAVLVVLGTHRVEVLACVEGIQPTCFLQIVEEGVRRGRIGQRDQIGHERRLERGRGQQHPGVPGVARLGPSLQEQAVEPVDRLGQASQAQVVGAQADGYEVVRGLCRLYWLRHQRVLRSM
jgi:hypothetical protein